jgi:virginiamycin B lyase
MVPEKRGKLAFYDDTYGDAALDGIVAGPDGALWFTDQGNSLIGRIATDGTYTLQEIISDGVSSGITVGPDKEL